MRRGGRRCVVVSCSGSIVEGEQVVVIVIRSGVSCVTGLREEEDNDDDCGGASL